MPVKTYSRQKAASSRNGEPATKRRRISQAIESDTENTDAETQEDALLRPSSTPLAPSSTPPRDQDGRFSDGPGPNSTPPSSPPPAASLPPMPPTRRAIFSFLKRKHAAASVTTPLGESDSNAQKFPARKRRRLTQMQIDLGGETRQACKICGMDYIPSNAEDAALHKKFHAMNFGGVDLKRSFVDSMRTCQAWKGEGGSCIIMISRKDPLLARNAAKKVLEVVNAELSAVEIGAEQLWSRVAVRDGLESVLDAAPRRVSNVQAGGVQDRFKAYLYIRGSKCIGLCLAERISEAYAVLDVSKDGTRQTAATSPSSSSITTKTQSDPAIVGISRIWTSNAHRKKGIAKILLDCVAGTFLYGLRIPADMIAFSQPTESGGQLARRWFGMDSGWHVYTD